MCRHIGTRRNDDFTVFMRRSRRLNGIEEERGAAIAGKKVVKLNAKVPCAMNGNKKEESPEVKCDPCAPKVIGRISHLDQDGPVAAPRRGWAASAFTFASANAGSSLYETVRTSNEVFPLWLLSSTCGYMGWRKYRT
jgi:hypothetical protein